MISQGKILLANEHCQFVLKPELALSLHRDAAPPTLPHNPTVIPDDLFPNLTPVFVIRHPLHVIRSNYESVVASSQIRPGHEDWTLATSLKTPLLLFEYFNERDGHPPLVVDGDDVLWRTQEVGEKE